MSNETNAKVKLLNFETLPISKENKARLKQFVEENQFEEFSVSEDYRLESLSVEAMVKITEGDQPVYIPYSFDFGLVNTPVTED